MSASIHPPVQLHIVLDEDSYQGGDSVEMARRFTAVAPTEVVRAAKGSQRANVLRFDLGDDAVTAEADADPLWRDALAALRQGVAPSDIAAEERAADADAGNVVASATKVEAAGHAKGDVDTSGEGCALEAGGVPEHLDYRVWNVAYADGTSVRFDSVLGEALLD